MFLSTCALAAIGLFLYRFRAVYLSAEQLLPRDSYFFQFLPFHYIGEHLKWTNTFPDWDYRYGVSLVPFMNNCMLLIPYRWFGYGLAWLGVPTVLAYKICFLFVGQGLFLLGVYLFHRKLTGSCVAGMFSIVLCLLSSLSFGIIHQEQVLATLFFIPWVGWAMLKSRETPEFALLAAALVGIGLNAHYPHLLFIYYSLIVIYFGRKSFSKLTPLAFVLLLIGASPLIFSYSQFHDKLSSTFRSQPDSIVASDFAEYHRMNTMGPSSVRPESFLLYLKDQYDPPHVTIGDLDDLSFHATLAFPLVLLISLLFKTPWRRFSVWMLISLSVCALGIFGPVPRLLWYVVPGLKIFRQWYHFVPLFTLHAVSFTTLVVYSLWSTPKLRVKIVAGFVVLLAVVSGVRQTWWATQRLESRLISTGPIPATSTESFYERMLFDYPLQSPLAVPREVRLPPIEDLTNRSIPRWNMEDGSYRRVDRSHFLFRATESGFWMRAENIPRGAVSLTLLQHDDGNWLMPTVPSADRLLTLHANNISEGINFERKKSLWWVTLLLHGTALFAALTIIRKKAGSNAPSPQSKLIPITCAAD